MLVSQRGLRRTLKAEGRAKKRAFSNWAAIRLDWPLAGQARLLHPTYMKANRPPSWSGSASAFLVVGVMTGRAPRLHKTSIEWARARAAWPSLLSINICPYRREPTSLRGRELERSHGLFPWGGLGAVVWPGFSGAYSFGSGPRLRSIRVRSLPLRIQRSRMRPPLKRSVS